MISIFILCLTIEQPGLTIEIGPARSLLLIALIWKLSNKLALSAAIEGLDCQSMDHDGWPRLWAGDSTWRARWSLIETFDVIQLRDNRHLSSSFEASSLTADERIMMRLCRLPNWQTGAEGWSRKLNRHSATWMLPNATAITHQKAETWMLPFHQLTFDIIKNQNSANS